MNQIKETYKKLLKMSNSDRIEVISTGDIRINVIYEEYAYATLKCGKYTMPMYSDLNTEIKNMLNAIESKHVTLDRYSDFLKISLETGIVEETFSISEIEKAGTLIMKNPTTISYYSDNLDDKVELVARTYHYDSITDIDLKEFSHILSLHNQNGDCKIRGVKHVDYNKTIENYEEIKNTNSNS